MADVAIQESGESERKEIIDRIREDVAELGRASPSGAETLHARIDGELQRLLMSPEERALKMPHPNEGTNPRAAGRNPSGPLTPPGVAFPVGVDVKDHSDAGDPPVPVAPASPDDIRAWQDTQIAPSGDVKPATVTPKADPDAEKKRLDDEATELKRVQDLRKQSDAGAPERNQKQAELDEAEAERKRILAKEMAAPRQADAPNPAPGAAQQAERDRQDEEARRRRAAAGMPSAKEPVPV